MKYKLGAEYSEEQYQEILFLYKHFGIEPTPISTALRKLYHSMYLEILEQSEPSTTSTNKNEELEELEGWECPYRILDHPYDKISKKREPKIACSNPMMNPTLKDILNNYMSIEFCKQCHEQGMNKKLLPFPDSKKPKKPTSKPQSKVVQKENSRNCKNPICDNQCYESKDPRFPGWIPDLCPVCHKRNQSSPFMKKQYPEWGFDPEGGFLIQQTKEE